MTSIFVLLCGVAIVGASASPAQQPLARRAINRITITAGTGLEARMLDSLSSTAVPRRTLVRAAVRVPLRVEQQIVIPAHSVLEGDLSAASTQRDDRHTAKLNRHAITVHFTRLIRPTGDTIAIDAVIAAVDNAKERVDSTGVIVGLASAHPRHAAAWSDALLGVADSATAATVLAGLDERTITRHRTIGLPPGTDVTLRVRGTVSVAPLRTQPPDKGHLDPALFTDIVAMLPLRAVADKGRAPGDVINVLMLGTRADVMHAFASAGWTMSEQTNLKDDLITLGDLVRGRGYAHQPVSVQLLNGHEPDLVYQRLSDSFARRHHARIWSRGTTIAGVPVWAATASHDVGLTYISATHRFSHLVSPRLDRERERVLDDVLYGGAVVRYGFRPRQLPGVIEQTGSTTPIQTDGALLLLDLRAR